MDNRILVLLIIIIIPLLLKPLLETFGSAFPHVGFLDSIARTNKLILGEGFGTDWDHRAHLDSISRGTKVALEEGFVDPAITFNS
jgi:hypothetical protein